MMATHQEGKGLGLGTTMCGDPKIWFPMRVTYSREMKVKAELDRLGIENFVPMTYKVVDADTDNPCRKLVPAIRNLIFVRSTQESISHLKSSNEVLEPLRYMIDNTAEEAHTIMTIPDRQMKNFMRVASRTDDSVMFLDDESVVGGSGDRRRCERSNRVCSGGVVEGDRVLIDDMSEDYYKGVFASYLGANFISGSVSKWRFDTIKGSISQKVRQ